MMISEGQTEHVDQAGPPGGLQVAPDLPARVLLTAPQCSHGTLDAHARCLHQGTMAHGHHGQTR